MNARTTSRLRKTGLRALIPVTLLSVLIVTQFALPKAHAALDAITSWVGNTHGGSGFVQMDLNDIYVSHDGTVYANVFWEEGGREIGIYKNGQTLGQMPDTDGNGGTSVTGNGTYVFGTEDNDSSLRRYNEGGFTSAPFAGGGGEDGSYKKDVGGEKSLQGLAASSSELFVSDSQNNTIRVFDVNSMNETRSFGFSQPGRLALDSSGNLWIVQTGSSPKVLHYSASGSQLSQQISLPSGTVPTDISIDNSGRVYVTDNGPNQQVQIYKNVDTSPTLDRTLGTTGGIFSGTPGEVQPLKFSGLVGVGNDDNGNIYVAGHGFGGNGSGAVIESYNTSSQRNWVLYGLEFVDSADVDPNTDGVDVYTDHEHFVMDYSQSAGHEWSYKGYTINPFKYPNDPRINPGTDGTLVRHFLGHTFLFMTNMYMSPFEIFRFNHSTDGETAIPAGHYTKVNSGSWGLNVDDNGNIWEATQGDGIYKTPVTGLDSNGSPVYGSPQHFNTPSPFNDLERIQYVASTDTMYLGGYTTDYPSQGDWGRVGRVVARYDNWSSNPTFRWQSNIIFNNTVGSNEATSMSVAGNYLFTGGVDTKAVLHVHSTNDGSYVGDLSPSGEVDLQHTGWIDIPTAVAAYKRANGEYVVFVEDDGYAKIVMYRWCPSGNCSSTPPPTPTPTPRNPTPTATATPTPGLPSPWGDQDVGSVGSSGSASYSGGTFTVKGSGSDIWNSADAFNYVYQSLNGDGTIVAKVNSVQNTDVWAKAGVMIRESLNSGAKHAFMAITSGNGAAFQYRSSTNGSSTNVSGASVSAPYWVKLVRSGNTFTGYVSSDGTNWTQVGSTTVSMASNVSIGLAVTAHNNSALNTSTFSNVSVTTSGGGTPTPTPTPTATPTPTPPPTASTTYEAEASNNTLGDGAVVIDCGPCSGGQSVGWVGSVQFNNVHVNTAGNYNVTVAYQTDAARSGVISVNGGSGTTYTFDGVGDWEHVGTKTVSLHLNAGDNTIRIYSSGDYAPDLDKITVG